MITEEWTFIHQGRMLSRQKRRATTATEMNEIYSKMQGVFNFCEIQRRLLEEEKEITYTLNVLEGECHQICQKFRSDSDFALFCIDMRKKGLQVR